MKPFRGTSLAQTLPRVLSFALAGPRPWASVQNSAGVLRNATSSLPVPSESRKSNSQSSLEEDGFADSSINAAWTTEVRRRLSTYDGGAMSAAGLTEAMTDTRLRVAGATGEPDR